VAWATPRYFVRRAAGARRDRNSHRSCDPTDFKARPHLDDKVPSLVGARRPPAWANHQSMRFAKEGAHPPGKVCHHLHRDLVKRARVPGYDPVAAL
jgi:hypothetical protein